MKHHNSLDAPADLMMAIEHSEDLLDKKKLQIVALYNKGSYRYTRRLQSVISKTVEDIPTDPILSIEFAEDSLDMIDCI